MSDINALKKAKSAKRIMKEIRQLEEKNNEFYNVKPKGDNIYLLVGTLKGPKDSAYEDQIYKLEIRLSENFPFKAPSVTFKDKIYHPNVGPSGVICVDILQNKWNPSSDLICLLACIQVLMYEPNPSSPLNGAAARLFRDKKAYYEKVKEVYDSNK